MTTAGRDDVELVVEPDTEPTAGVPRHPVTARGDTSRVPNLTACSIAGPCQLDPGHTPGEPEVVLDPRRAAPPDHRWRRPPRRPRPVPPRRRTRPPLAPPAGTHHQQVTPALVGVAPQVDPERGRQVSGRRSGQHAARPVTTAAPASGNGQVSASSAHADGSVRSTARYGIWLRSAKSRRRCTSRSVVPGQHQTALAQALQQTSAGVQRGQQDVAQLPRRLHQPRPAP